ncbi:hypothetical protein ACO2Q2_09765 [Dyella sp. KRB-257]|uniref:hypothetical protein n=1 Tax=Dyella sp. KRB-257 TaxID=3400915 RepID=UPI003BFC41EF
MGASLRSVGARMMVAAAFVVLVLSYPLSHWMALQPWWVQCNVVVLTSFAAFFFAGLASHHGRGRE